MQSNIKHDAVNHRGLTGTVRLIAGLAVIWVFVFVLAPWLQLATWVGSVHAAAGQRGIDAGTLFYTETEVFSEAETVIRASTGGDCRTASGDNRQTSNMLTSGNDDKRRAGR